MNDTALDSKVSSAGSCNLQFSLGLRSGMKITNHNPDPALYKHSKRYLNVIDKFITRVNSSCIWIDYLSDRGSDTFKEGDTLVASVLRICNTSFSLMLDIAANITIINGRTWIPIIINSQSFGQALGLSPEVTIYQCGYLAALCLAKIRARAPYSTQEPVMLAFKQYVASLEPRIQSIHKYQKATLVILLITAALVSSATLYRLIPAMHERHNLHFEILN